VVPLLESFPGHKKTPGDSADRGSWIFRKAFKQNLPSSNLNSSGYKYCAAVLGIRAVGIHAVDITMISKRQAHVCCGTKNWPAGAHTQLERITNRNALPCAAFRKEAALRKIVGGNVIHQNFMDLNLLAEHIMPLKNNYKLKA
jgi:hypothetical protein